jgi:C4-dicarboxylate-specific signal transduction histidine kinase
MRYNDVRSELAHLARIASLGTLTASIAHGISQPLTGILTNTGACVRILSAASPNIDSVREALRRALRDGQRIAARLDLADILAITL